MTPASGLATDSELIAVTKSPQPLLDLRNIVNAYNLSSSIDLSRSAVILNSGGTNLLQIGLSTQANKLFVQQRLLGTGLYTSVAQNYVYSSSLGDLRERVPNDPQVGQQYYHTIIQTPTAWDKTVGTSNVVVAILDDGVATTHPDLRNTIWSNTADTPGDGIDNDGNGFSDDVNGWNFVGNNNNVNPTDPIADDHGTEVAGVLAAQIDNAAGIAGVAGGIRFMPLKVVDTGGSTTSLTLARAVSYAVQNGAKIINMSINVDPFVDDPTYTAALSLAYDRGLLLVNSAGNANGNNPARVKIEEALFVAASDRNDAKTAYSNYGSGIDVTAPGGTADDGLLTTIPVSGYATAFGTSMASPLVAGVAALVWSAYPTYTRDQVAAAVLANADSILAKNQGFEDQLGSGRLNAAKSVSGNKIVTGLGKLTGLPDEGADAPSSLGSFNLRLKGPLDAATVVPTNFELRWAGPDNLFGTADDGLLPLEINNGREYKIGTNDLTFDVNRSLSRGLYRFTARSGGLRDPFGSPVDGDGNGSAGGNLVRNFGISDQVSGTVYEDVQNTGSYVSSDPRIGGVPVFLDVNGNGLLDSQFFSTSVRQTIPNSDGSATAIPIAVSNLTSVVNGLSVSLQLTYPQLSALTVTLIAPDGTRVKLLNHRNLPNPGFASSFLTFRDGIAEQTNDLGTVLSYFLQPDESLSNFNGHAANGIWQIEIQAAAGSGSFNGGSFSITTEPVAISDANGFFAFNNLPAGQFFLNVGAGAGYHLASSGPVPVDTTGSNVPPVTLGLIQTAGIVGHVSRDTGAPLPPSVVFIDTNRDGVPNDGELSTASDASGLYRFLGLPDGVFPVAVVLPPGYHIAGGGTTRQSVTLTADAPVATNVDFVVQKNTSPVVVTITPGIPAVLNTPVNLIDFTLSEPLPNLRAADLTLSRDGQLVSLTGTTLIGSGTHYSLLGLGDLTAAGGVYSFGVTAPAPAGEPGRKPAFTSVTWTNDQTSPTIRLEGLFEHNNLVGLMLVASKPITGLDVADFTAFDSSTRPIVISASTLDLAGDGLSAVLRFPAGISALPFIRIELTGPGSDIQDAAGNEYLDETGFAFSRPVQRPNAPVVHRTVIGADAGSSPTVRIFDTATGTVLKTFVVFEPDFTGGVRVATSDLNGDGVEDIIAAAGPGGGPRVRIFDGSSFAALSEFMAFEDSFTGGLFVSTGDINGDGSAEIVLSPDVGGGPRVRILDGKTLVPVADFFGIADENFRGGARTGVGDLNGDGTPDLLVAAGFGGGPRVAGFDGRTLGSGPQHLFNDFFAFDPSLRNGVYLAAGMFDSDHFADLVIGAGPGGGPRVLVLSGQALTTAGGTTPMADFFAGDVNSRAGIRVATKPSQTNGGSDLFTADGLGAGNQVRQYAGQTLTQHTPVVLTEFDAFENLFGSFSGVFVG